MRRLVVLVSLVVLGAAGSARAVPTVPDPGFGSGGIVSVSTSPAGEREGALAMVVDPLGRVLVGGNVDNNEPSDNNAGWVVTRFTAEGKLDTGFGVGGVARPPGLYGPGLGDVGEQIQALALVPGSDKIIAGGTSRVGSGTFEFTVARLNGDGSLDMSFGPADTGFVRTDVSASADTLKSLAVSPSGAITAVGGAGLNAALVRWDSDGALDPSFDGPAGTGNGKFVDDVTAGFDDYRNVQVEPGGEVRAVGTASGAEGDWIIARYTATGDRDTLFNGTGVRVTNFSGQSDLGQAQVLVDGTLFVFGSVDEDPTPTTRRDFAAFAFDPVDGADISAAPMQIPLPGTQNLFGAALQRLGGSPALSAERFVMTGTGAYASGSGALVMRFRRVGGTSDTLEPDPEFGVGGVVAPPASGGVWAGAATDAAGRLLVGGNIGNFDTADFAAARFIEQASTSVPGGATDTVAAVMSRVGMSPKVWAVNPRGRAEARVSRRRVHRGTTFRYTLSESARVVFRVERKAKGRRVGRRCRPATRRNAGRRRCIRYVHAGSFAQAGQAGANRKAFSGKIGRGKLRPGQYRATLTATDAVGNVSKPKRLSFRVVRS